MMRIAVAWPRSVAARSGNTLRNAEMCRTRTKLMGKNTDMVYIEAARNEIEQYT